MAGFMIAAPRSGSGKTMVTCGILELLKRKQKNLYFPINVDRTILTGCFIGKSLALREETWTVSLNSHRT